MGHGKSKLSSHKKSRSASVSGSTNIFVAPETTQPTTTTATTPRSDSDAGGGGGWSRRRAEELFGKYRAADNAEILGPDEVVRLCSDLQTAPEDVAVLVLAWHMQAKSMGYFTREEFVDGLRRMRVETLPQLRARVRTMRAELADASTFRDVFRFAFLYSREGDAKIVDLQTADALLALLLPAAPATLGRFTPRFRAFLKEQGAAGLCKGLNIDQWTSFLDLSTAVSQDLADYDPDGAWPVLLDDFVAWCRSANH